MIGRIPTRAELQQQNLPKEIPEDLLLACPRCGRIIHPKQHSVTDVDKESKIRTTHIGYHCPRCYVNLTKRK